MKFRRFISLLVIAAILIAFFTNPKETAFTSFIQPKVNRSGSGPVIVYKNNLIYSIVDITYFTPTSDNDGKPIASASKEKYIGLFGKFWKLED